MDTVSNLSVATAQTLNGNPSYATIGKPHLDYFGGVTRQSEQEEIEKLAKECIDSDVRLALVTFFQKRDCREGAGERKPFLFSMKLLSQELRRTFYSLIPEYGYWDDLNGFARNISEDQDFIAEMFAKRLLANIQSYLTNSDADHNLEKWIATQKQEDDNKWKAVSRILKAFNQLCTAGIDVRYAVRSKVRVVLQNRLQKIDPNTVIPEEGDIKITSSLPEVQLFIKRTKHLIDKINKLPIKITHLTAAGYRHWCSFSRCYHEVIEHFKSTKEWDLIIYSGVPSIAYDRTKKQFSAHDGMRFKAHEEAVKKGESKINVGRLMPYQLIEQTASESRDLQWNEIVKETRKFYQNIPAGNPFRPENAIHVADISGSMTSSRTRSVRPIDVSLSLAILMAQVGNRPLYTFSGQTKKYMPTWKSLTEAQQTIKDQNCNTNFRGLIDRIYDDCVKDADKKRVPPSDCFPSSIYVYTDGGFDQMCQEDPKTAAKYIQGKFGAFQKVPVFIFWNVAGNVKDFAAHVTMPGIVQVAGFSKDLFKIFLTLTDVSSIGPEIFFRTAVMTDRYQPIFDLYDQVVKK